LSKASDTKGVMSRAEEIWPRFDAKRYGPDLMQNPRQHLLSPEKRRERTLSPFARRGKNPRSLRPLKSREVSAP